MTTSDGELRRVAATGRTSPKHIAKIAVIDLRYATKAVSKGRSRGGSKEVIVWSTGIEGPNFRSDLAPGPVVLGHVILLVSLYTL